MKSALLLQATLLFLLNHLNRAQESLSSKSKVSLRGTQTRRHKQIVLNEDEKTIQSRLLQKDINKEKNQDWRPNKKQQKRPELEAKEFGTEIGKEFNKLITNLFTPNSGADKTQSQSDENEVTNVSEEISNQWEEVISEEFPINAAPPAPIDPECLEGLFHIETVDEDTSTGKYDYFLNLDSGMCVVVDSRGCPDFFREDQVIFSKCAP